MARKLPKISQPPIDPAARSSERHGLIVGILLAAAAVVVVIYGVILPRDISGKPQSELWMVDKARLGRLSAAVETKPAPTDGEKTAQGDTGGATKPDDTNKTENNTAPQDDKKPDDFCPT